MKFIRLTSAQFSLTNIPDHIGRVLLGPTVSTETGFGWNGWGFQ